MNIDTGLAVVIGAGLVFYLRLIILQRQRVKSLQRPPVVSGKKQAKYTRQLTHAARYSILSSKRRDWVIAGSGVIAIVIGLLLYAEVFPWEPGRDYWWAPTAAGIIAFSWGFRL